jgi:hypothetical protein
METNHFWLLIIRFLFLSSNNAFNSSQEQLDRAFHQAGLSIMIWKHGFQRLPPSLLPPCTCVELCNLCCDPQGFRANRPTIRALLHVGPKSRCVEVVQLRPTIFGTGKWANPSQSLGPFFRELTEGLPNTPRQLASSTQNARRSSRIIRAVRGVQAMRGR